jgi:hypothetical protein
MTITISGSGNPLDVDGTNTGFYSTLMTAQATTSGTFKDFTGIPSWVKRVTVMFDTVSLGTAASAWLIQLGDSGGIENTGYTSASNEFTSGGVGADNSTAGFVIRNNNIGYTFSGQMIISNMTGNTWVESGIFASPATIYTTTTAGVKTLSSTLTQLRVTTVAGTSSFDSGTINVLYE